MISKQNMGISVFIHEENEECIIEAKRLGLLMDRVHELHIRKGDKLILYFSHHDQE